MATDEEMVEILFDSDSDEEFHGFTDKGLRELGVRNSDDDESSYEESSPNTYDQP